MQILYMTAMIADYIVYSTFHTTALLIYVIIEVITLSRKHNVRINILVVYSSAYVTLVVTLQKPGL